MAKRVYGILSLSLSPYMSFRTVGMQCSNQHRALPFFFARDSNLHTLDDHTAASICRCVEEKLKKKISSQTISSSAHSPLYTLFSPLIFFLLYNFQFFLMLLLSLSLPSQSSSFAFGMLLFSSSSPSSPRRRLSLELCVLCPDIFSIAFCSLSRSFTEWKLYAL